MRREANLLIFSVISLSCALPARKVEPARRQAPLPPGKRLKSLSVTFRPLSPALLAPTALPSLPRSLAHPRRTLSAAAAAPLPVPRRGDARGAGRAAWGGTHTQQHTHTRSLRNRRGCELLLGGSTPGPQGSSPCGDGPPVWRGVPQAAASASPPQPGF